MNSTNIIRSLGYSKDVASHRATESHPRKAMNNESSTFTQEETLTDSGVQGLSSFLLTGCKNWTDGTVIAMTESVEELSSNSSHYSIKPSFAQEEIGHSIMKKAFELTQAKNRLTRTSKLRLTDLPVSLSRSPPPVVHLHIHFAEETDPRCFRHLR